MNSFAVGASLSPGLTPVLLPGLSQEPLVSILVSNYNYARFAPEAIESALAQTYRKIELVLVDDGSTDDSVAIFEKYAQRDSRIRVITKPNGGQATGFNTAFRNCYGDIICLLDTDDVYRNNKVERVVETFWNSPRAGCVVNRVMRVDADRRSRGPLPLLARLPTGWYGPTLLKTGGVLPDVPGGGGLNFRRAVADRIFPVPEYPPLNMCPDMVMLRLVPFLTPIAAVQEPVAEVRLHGANSYIRRRLSAETIQRELDLCQHLWEAQRKFLNEIDSSLASELVSPESDRTILVLKYIHARLSDSVSHLEYHQRLMNSRWSDRENGRWFWKAAAYFPKPMFVAAINLLMAQNKVKDLLSRLLSK